MRVVDPGHRYKLTKLDGNGSEEELVFVKRIGEKYPGNTSEHSGTTVQEVLRACIDRLHYVNNQITSDLTSDAIYNIREALFSLEKRAAIRHERPIDFNRHEVVYGIPCLKCNHIGCHGECHK